jgi:hypothetical protein
MSAYQLNSFFQVEAFAELTPRSFCSQVDPPKLPLTVQSDGGFKSFEQYLKTMSIDNNGGN